LKKHNAHFSINNYSKLNPKKFFIIGCQRSGTTLVRLILDSHSQIMCRDEPPCYYILSHTNELKKQLQKAENKKWCGFKIPRLTEQLNNTSLFDVGIKNVSKPFTNFYQNDPFLLVQVMYTENHYHYQLKKIIPKTQPQSMQ